MLLLEDQSITNSNDDGVMDMYMEPPNESDFPGAVSADEDESGINANNLECRCFLIAKIRSIIDGARCFQF